jgi:hypothetical protein
MKYKRGDFFFYDRKGENLKGKKLKKAMIFSYFNWGLKPWNWENSKKVNYSDEL